MVLQALEEAVTNMEEMQDEEGRVLQEDLLARIRRLNKSRAPS